MLELTHAPTNSNGIFFMGTGQKNTPFGAGKMCVGGVVKRFPVQNAGPCGTMIEGPGIAAAMNIVAVPTDELSLDVINQILRGGADKVAEAEAAGMTFD